MLERMKLRFGTGCTLIALVLAPSLAFADEDDDVPRPPPTERPSDVDTITLRSGAILRGRVTEIVAGDHVSLVLPTGETWRVPWSAVERLVVATTSFPPPPPAPAAPAPAPAAASRPAAMVGPRVRVHISSSGPAYLYRRAAGTSEFVTACEAPCDAEMPLGDSYKIGGSGKTTNEFCLKGSPSGGVELRVDGASWIGVVGGSVIATGGILTAYVGLIVAVAGKDDEAALGLGCLVLGGAAIGLGLFVVNRSSVTDLTQKKLRPGHDAFARAPAWRSAGTSEPLRPPPAMAPWLFERRF